MPKIFLLLIAIALIGGCSTPSNISDIPREEAECNMAILSEREKGNPEALCFLNAVAARCSSVDSCLLKCWSDRAGEGIGGGCHHICWGYAPEDWKAPSDAKNCAK